MTTDPATLVCVHEFPGLYCSWLSEELDEIERQFCNDESEENSDSLSAEKYAEIVFDVASYGDMYTDAAKVYAEAFNTELDALLDNTNGLTFESMSSPREYNFTTDRLFMHVPAATLGHWWQLSADDNHKTLGHVITQRFTSYDGFMSYYSNRLDDWLATPLADWDHNEIGALLTAVIHMHDADMFDEHVMHQIFDGGELYCAFHNNVDWGRFETLVSEAVADQ